MNVRLSHFIETYSELERGVQELVSAQCGPVCGLCTVACCCRADLCEEALESRFLRLLHNKKALESDRYGFLTESGCSLRTGRPPVCYEFFCEELLDSLPDEQHRNMLRILGRLPAHVGEKALGEQHLTEISDANALESLNFQVLGKKLQESFQCLEFLRSFFDQKTLRAGADRVLSRIEIAED